MKKDEARRFILGAWDDWAAGTLEPSYAANRTDALRFFAYLQTERSELLKFRTAGDRWQIVHGWLLDSGRITD